MTIPLLTAQADLATALEILDQWAAIHVD